MLLLALDTATPAVTVAVHDGSRVLGEHTTVDARRHGELLAPQIEAALRDAGQRPGDLTGVAVGVGPGPFTGLRVGLVTARVLGDTLAIPVYGVCSLDVLARAAVSSAAVDAGPFVVATDARRREVYWARYDASGVRCEGPAVGRPADLPVAVRSLPAVGAGAALYPEDFPLRREPVHPAAGVLAGLVVERLVDGGGGPAELLPPEPLYLRRPDAVPPTQRKPVTAHA